MPNKQKPKKMFEIVMKSFKSFYVEAASQEEAFEMDVVDDEASSFGRIGWEHEETAANEMSPEEADRVRKFHPKRIMKDE